MEAKDREPRRGAIRFRLSSRYYDLAIGLKGQIPEEIVESVEVPGHDAIVAEAGIERAIGVEAYEQGVILSTNLRLSGGDDLAVGLHLHGAESVGTACQIDEHLAARAERVVE
jgi:hypothetical protein